MEISKINLENATPVELSNEELLARVVARAKLKNQQAGNNSPAPAGVSTPSAAASNSAGNNSAESTVPAAGVATPVSSDSSTNVAAPAADETPEDKLDFIKDVVKNQFAYGKKEIVALAAIKFPYDLKTIGAELVKEKVMKANEFKHYHNVYRFEKEENLEFKGNAHLFVKEFFEARFYEVSAQGVITRNLESCIANDEGLLRTLENGSGTKEHAAYIASCAEVKYGGKFDGHNIITELKDINIKYEFGFKDSDLKTSVESRIQDEKTREQNKLCLDIIKPYSGKAWGEAEFNGFFDYVFPDDDTPNDIKILAFKQFIWNVKYVAQKKMNLDNPLMIVLFGHQGSGKSRFVQWLLKPVKDMAGESTLGNYCDEKSQGTKEDNLVVHIAEMAGANKQDSEYLKNAMEAGLSQTRAMYSTTSMHTYNRAQLIGTSNKDITQVIKDDTGNRRFIQFTLGKRGLNISYDQFDVWGLWNSVKASDAEPLSDNTARMKLAAKQDTQRKLSIYEAWFVDKHGDYHDERTGKSYEGMFADFRDYVDMYGTDFDKRNISLSSFRNEIRNCAKNRGLKIKDHKPKGKTMIRWFE